MDIKIREVELFDYKELLDTVKIAMNETDFLSCSGNELNLDYEDEKKYINDLKTSKSKKMFVATYKGKLVGGIDFRGSDFKRSKHYGTIGLFVLKKYWAKGIGTKLIDTIIDWAKENGIKKINLEVVINNKRAIELYERKGFKLEGNIEMGKLIDNEFIDMLIYGLKI